MPTSTFYRLPEEKRRRLTDAAWQEFARVPCSEVSINRIIQASRIPRGSFYQYFTDKEDLTAFLLQSMAPAFQAALAAELQAHGGCLASALLALFDGLFLRSGAPDLSAARHLSFLLKNPGLDWRRITLPPGGPAAETARLLAVTAFTDSCKDCCFHPEEAGALRERLARTLSLLASLPADQEGRL